MKLKRPKISHGRWTIHQSEEEGVHILSDADSFGVCGIVCEHIDNQRDADALAALPDVMDLLEGIVAKAVRYAEDPKGQTRALWQIEDMAKEALLKMGYTEEKEDDVCDECGREIPIANGGSLSNKHHAESCSLYDPSLP